MSHNPNMLWNALNSAMVLIGIKICERSLKENLSPVPLSEILTVSL